MFATLSGVPGAVAQSGSAPRSHRGGQGFKSPQLHPEAAGQAPSGSIDEASMVTMAHLDQLTAIARAGAAIQGRAPQPG